jgi:hypothetical protein
MCHAVDSNPEHQKQDLLFKVAYESLWPNIHTEVKVHPCRFERDKGRDNKTRDA